MVSPLDSSTLLQSQYGGGRGGGTHIAGRGINGTDAGGEGGERESSERINYCIIYGRPVQGQPQGVDFAVLYRLAVGGGATINRNLAREARGASPTQPLPERKRERERESAPPRPHPETISHGNCEAKGE